MAIRNLLPTGPTVRLAKPGSLAENLSTPELTKPGLEKQDTEILRLRVFTRKLIARDKVELIPTGGFIVILATMITVTLLGVLVINMRLDQQAFTLQHLKSERNAALDAKDAIQGIVDGKFSPNYLAGAAKKLGMVPADKLTYIYLDGNK